MAQFCPVRRALLSLLAVLIMATALSVVTGSAADAAPSVDKRLSQGQCALTGRAWVAGRGCARHHCVKDATIFKEGHDAELCQLSGPRRRRVRPPDQLPPLQGPWPDLDR